LISYDDVYNNHNQNNAANSRSRKNYLQKKYKRKRYSMQQTKKEFETGLSPLGSSYNNYGSHNNIGGMYNNNNNNKNNGNENANDIVKVTYHNRYVKDLSNNYETGNDKLKLIEKETRDSRNRKRKWWQSSKVHRHEDARNNSKSKMMMRKAGGIIYAAPRGDFEKKSPLHVTMLILARSLVLERVEELLHIERVENSW
jgi:hypothetical protein